MISAFCTREIIVFVPKLRKVIYITKVLISSYSATLASSFLLIISICWTINRASAIVKNV